MSASSNLFLDHREKYNCVIDRAFYEENISLLSGNVKITKTIIESENELFKNDEHYNLLMSEYRKANKNLQDYKYNKRHNFKK